MVIIVLHAFQWTSIDKGTEGQTVVEYRIENHSSYIVLVSWWRWEKKKKMSDQPKQNKKGRKI